MTQFTKVINYFDLYKDNFQEGNTLSIVCEMTIIVKMYIYMWMTTSVLDLMEITLHLSLVLKIGIHKSYNFLHLPLINIMN